MTTKPWKYPRNDTQLIPLQHLLKLEHGEQNGKGQLTKQMNA